MYLKATLLWQDLVFFLCRILVLNLKVLGALKSNSRRFQLWKNGVSTPTPHVYSKEVFCLVQCHHMSFCGLRGPPSWAWQECN